jgi:uncharacterized protein YjiK
MSICSEMKSIFNARILILFMLLFGSINLSCNKSHPSDSSIPSRELILVSEVILPFTEPSGICYSESLQKLWVVSGGDQTIYMLDINGNVEKELPYTGTDLEGIAFDSVDSTLWIIDEATKKVSHLDCDGKVLFHKHISYSSTENKGPEGITIGKNHMLYIINERDPCVLLRLDSNCVIEKTYPLDFASDFSDLTYDASGGSLYLLSDESRELYLWNESQGVIFRYPLETTGNEGVAIDEKRNIFYIVNDPSAKLLIYREK